MTQTIKEAKWREETRDGEKGKKNYVLVNKHGNNVMETTKNIKLHWDEIEQMMGFLFARFTIWSPLPVYRCLFYVSFGFGCCWMLSVARYRLFNKLLLFTACFTGTFDTYKLTHKNYYIHAVCITTPWTHRCYHRPAPKIYPKPFSIGLFRICFVNDNRISVRLLVLYIFV